ncbi:ubiquitin carboxyl-terminal hydrolase 4 [Grus japonensis]|uniref:Ubiquitin carboxyl-terminal hydrolase 4 n=1 Tax=Grus japonensis TaxID=30415 RepID=A0ABC9YGX5_GRUJA
MLWNFTPEQLQDPDKVTDYLKGKCCGYSKEAQLIALCWALANIYQTLLDSRQCHLRLTGTEASPSPATGTVATQTLATDTVATQTPVTGSAGEPKNQPVLTSVAPIHKKKYTKKSVRLVKDDDELGPSQEQEEEPEPEVITRSLSLSELRDMWKDFSRLPGEHILTWLLRCWDNGASSLELEGREAKQLGSLSREGGIDKAMGKKTQALSLWRRLLSSGRERYPFSEDVICRPGKWTTMERGIQYLREVAVREMVYYDPDNTQLPTDPDEVQCTRPMWWKFVQSAPSSYANSLAVIDWKSEEAPTVDEVAGRLWQYEDSLSSSLISAVEKLLGSFNNSARMCPTPHLYRPVFQLLGVSVPLLQRGDIEGTHHEAPRGFFLHDHREDMRKWDGKPTSILQARVRELQGKTVVKRDSSRKNAAPLSTGQPPRISERPDHTYDPLEGTSKSFLQEVSSEYDGQD